MSINIRPLKSLGQNFLRDPHYLNRIADAARIGPEDQVLEILVAPHLEPLAVGGQRGQMALEFETVSQRVSGITEEISQLRRLIEEDGLRGMTSNPSIFEKAIAGSTLYQDFFDSLANRSDLDAKGRFELLAIRDTPNAIAGGVAIGLGGGAIVLGLLADSITGDTNEVAQPPSQSTP